MNWLKNGPELKKPDLKVPPFVGDLYFDLRERRLLPILVLAVVAIVAVPILLGGGSEEEEAGGSGTAGAIAGASGTQASHFTVVESKPGLRDYRKRLARRSPTDPFKQRFTGQELKGAELNPESGEESVSMPVEGGSSITTEEPVSPTPEESGGDSGGGSPQSGGGGGNPQPGDLVFFAWAIDVKITKSGSDGSAAERRTDGLASGAGEEGGDGVTARSPVELASESEPTIRHKVLPLTKLPGDKQPVATYMGLSKHGFPLFLVSSKVKSVFGESKCVSGDDSCQLIEVEPKFPITFVYGANEVRYTFNVLKKEFVVTGHS
jgi:hypothetical protein